MRKTYFLMGALLIGALVCSISVVADEEPNNDQDEAERLDSGDSTWGSVFINDTEDWYVIEVAPFEKVTVEMELTFGSYLFVTDYLEDEETSEGEVFISLDSSNDEGSDSYTNDEFEVVDLYLKVNGDGTYDMKLTVEATSGTCCCGSFIFVGLVLLGAFVVIRKMR